MKRFSSPLTLYLILAGLVLLLQPMKAGFAPGHHGWVSAHTLAEISNATPANYFLGFTQKTLTDGKPDYLYFDRYPIFFSGGMNLILSTVWDRLDLSIYLARQMMNIIFLISVFFIWRIGRLILEDDDKASMVTAFVISSSLLVKYKDMVHFDQPAILGCLLVLNGILEYEFRGKKQFLITASLLGPLLGRGYAVIFFLAGWVLVRFIKDYLQSKKLFASIPRVPVMILFLSIPLPVLFLGSNIYSEAKIRNVSLKETSIVMSASHRLGFQNYKTQDAREKKFSWPSYVSNQVQRTFDFFTPYYLYGLHVKDFKRKTLHYSSLLPKAIFQILLLFLLIKFFPVWWKSLENKRKYAFYYLSGGGILWMLVMRNLAHYHEYVTLYLIGLVIVCGCFVVESFHEKWKSLKLISICGVVLSLILHSGIGWVESNEVRWQSREFQKIRHELRQNNAEVVYLTPDQHHFFLDGVKWGDSFFLSGFTITHKLEEAQKKIVKVDSRIGPTLMLSGVHD